MKLFKEIQAQTRLAFLCLTLLFINPAINYGQEFNFTVAVNSDRVRSVDRGVFDDMETAFQQFYNQRKWTDDSYEPHERLKCNLNIIIDEMPSIGQFKASVQIQSARPIYNTNYESTLFNYADRNWQFEYVESQPLIFSDNIFNSNITSLLAFYAYIILGLDYDSFSELGGNPHFQKALMVVNNAQQTNMPGWKSLESNRNRYWLIENYTNRRFDDIRKGMYTYHRLALDTFADQPDEGRRMILPLLESMQKLNKQFPGSILIISVLDAKAPELVNIFSEGDIQVRRQAFNLLSDTNPSRREQYAEIVE